MEVDTLKIGKELLSFDETKREIEAISALYGEGLNIELLPPDFEGMPKSEYEGKHIGILRITEVGNGRVFTGYIWPVNLRKLHTYQAVISRTLHMHECKDEDGKKYC